MKEVLTTCGYCGCGCNFYAHVHQERIVAVSPKKGHPVNDGMLCAKGWLGHDFATHQDRLQTPLIRREDGQLHEATWDEALETVAEKLRPVREKNPQAFALFSSARCSNEENYLATKLCRAVMGSPHIDHCARL